MPNSIIFLFAGIVGVAIGIVIMLIAGKMGLDRSREKSQDILDEANSKAETSIRQANLDGKQQVYEMKLQAEKEIKSQRDKIQQTENTAKTPQNLNSAEFFIRYSMLFIINRERTPVRTSPLRPVSMPSCLNTWIRGLSCRTSL